MSVPAPRLGVWTAVHGTRRSFRRPDDPVDASWARNRAQVLELERLGDGGTLIAGLRRRVEADHRERHEALVLRCRPPEAETRRVAREATPRVRRSVAVAA